MSDAWGDSWSLSNSNCVDGVCGTGEWSGPLPGDPDNNSTLTANAAYGGINVSWTYPALNPYAVIHTRLYRGITSNFAESVFQQIVAGSTFFDKIPKDHIKKYYYWIELVSVNSTVGAPIGPASATPLAAVDETLEDLYGRIDKSFLAESLRSELGNIPLLRNDLDSEAVMRIYESAAMSEALAAVQSETGEALTYLQNTVTQQANAQEALVTTLNSLAAGMNGFSSALVEEQLVRADKDSTLAIQVTTTKSQLEDNIAAVEVVMGSQIATVNNKVTEIGALYSAKVKVNGLIGGFGIYNNGVTVDAGFDVDTFWVGRTTANKAKPFVVNGDVVYLDKARIRDADIGTLKIAGNAVTVPTVGTQSGSTAGNGSYTPICSAYVSNANNNSAMSVIVMVGGVAGYSAGIKTTSFKIVHEGVGVVNEAYNIGGDYVTTPTMIGYATVPANSGATFTFVWAGADSTVNLSGGKVVVLGAKR